MLRLIAYDITDPRRLRRVAQTCEDFGVRVQKSVFECWLDRDRFEELWISLCAEICRAEDSLIAYSLDAQAARGRRAAGDVALLTEKRTRVIV